MNVANALGVYVLLNAFGVSGDEIAAGLRSFKGVVRRQQDIGIDQVNDGEYGHPMGQRYNYGPWWSYVFGRLGGLELAEMDLRSMPLAAPRTGELTLGRFTDRRDRKLFSDAYADPGSGASLPATSESRRGPVCRGPITYQGQDAVQRDIANLKAALDVADAAVAEGDFAG